MSIFEDVSLAYKDKIFVIPAAKVMRFIYIIEQNFKPADFTELGVRAGVTAAVLYEPMLKYAGAVDIDFDYLCVYFANNTSAVTELCVLCVGLLNSLVAPDSLHAFGVNQSESFQKKTPQRTLKKPKQ